MRSAHRLDALDGLRGLAILLVMGLHYFHTLAASPASVGYYPYGNTFADFFVFKYGYLGVELFFVISGFVIAMTLDRCSSPAEFALKRLSRIWPPLLVAAVMTFLVIVWIPTPFASTARQTLANFVPSLTLTPLEMWTWISPDIRFIDFVYWSLVVEIRFYIIAAALFWLFKRRRLGRNLVAFTCIVIVAKTIAKIWSAPLNEAVFKILIVPYLPWFAAGAVFYELYQHRMTLLHALACLLPTSAIIAYYSFVNQYSFVADDTRSPYMVIAAMVIIFAAFTLIALRSSMVRILESAPLVWVGLRSYSIYLLHFELGSSAISVIPASLPLVVQLLVVGGIVAAAFALSHWMFLFVERPGQRFVMKIFSKHHVAMAR